MPPPDPRALGELAIAVATEAAEEAARLRQVGVAVESKSTPTDLVTTADRAVEELVRARLGAARPDDEVIGEELGADGGRPTPGGVRWIVDPIDGTTNFVYDHPGWSVSVAAELDGVVVAGAVVDPRHGDTFGAVLGAGARCHDRTLRIPDPPRLAEVLLATGFGYDGARRRAQAEVMVEVLPEIRDLRRMGSAAVDLCSVAAGRVDAYFEWGLQLWDYAAGALVASEAGARVGDLGGGPPRPDGRLLVAHPALWDALADLLGRAGAAAPSD